MAGSIGTVATSTYSGSTASLIYHHKDHLGGTHVESDSSGTSVEYIIYTPFGGTLVDVKAGSYENDHKYTDKEKDEDTGLYYYGARYYNSTIGMFTAQDPVYLRLGTESLVILQDPQQLNSYSYTRNNPIRFIDPSGESISVYMEKGSIRDGIRAVYGHTFLDVNGTMYSWGNGGGNLTSDLLSQGTDSYLALNGKNSDSFSVYTFDTTSEQEQAVAKFYEGLRDNYFSHQYAGDPDLISFDLFSNNCTDILVDALQSGGILDNDFDLPGISTPGKLKERLDQKYNSQQSGGFFHDLSNWWNQEENGQVSNISNRETLITGDK